MADQYNSKNELLELSIANGWDQPTFRILPDALFTCEIIQTVPQPNAEPRIFQAVGAMSATKKAAEKVAASAMIALLADHTQQDNGAELACSPDYDIPQLPVSINYINKLSELTVAKGWTYPIYKRLPATIAPETVRLCTFVTVNTAGGYTCRSRSFLRSGSKDAKQEASARVLIELVVSGCVRIDEIPPSLHEVAAAAQSQQE